METEETESITCLCNERYRKRRLIAWRMVSLFIAVMLLMVFVYQDSHWLIVCRMFCTG